MTKNRSALAAQNTYTENEKNRAKAERELRKLIKRGREKGDPILIGSAYFYLGICRYDIMDSEGMFTNAYKAVAFLKDTKEYDMLVRSYVLLGYSYEQQEYFNMQLDVYECAHKIIRRHRLGMPAHITTLNNLASCYHHMGDFKTAVKVQKECVRLHAQHRPEDVTRTLMYSVNMAEFLFDNGEPEKAMEALDSIKHLIPKAEYKPYVCDYYLRKAIVLFGLGKNSRAGKCVDSAFGYIEEGIYPHQIFDDLRIAGHRLIELGDKERSRRIFELMQGFARDKQGNMEQIIAYRTMAEYYAANGEDKLAIECYEKLQVLNEKRRDELDRIQLQIHKRESDTENEIQALKRKLAKTEEIAFLDPLTQLLNRAALLRVASDFIEAAAKKKEKVGAIFIDIDYFKQCNDTYGHAKGDEILRELAKICKREETANIRFARYGGDEFFGIAKGLSDKELTKTAQNICRKIREADIPNKHNPNGHRVTLSVGLANVPITAHTDTIIEIANYADKAVYYAKNDGKDRICFLDHGRKDAGGKDAQFVRVEF